MDDCVQIGAFSREPEQISRASHICLELCGTPAQTPLALVQGRWLDGGAAASAMRRSSQPCVQESARTGRGEAQKTHSRALEQTLSSAYRG